MRLGVLLGVFAVAACGSEFPAKPFMTATSASGQVQLALRSSPQQPPVRGVSTIRFAFTDTASGSAVNGLTITIEPFMVAMGHGTSVNPSVTPAGGGEYDASNVYLPMPGLWELRTTLTGPFDDSVTPAFQVQ